MTATIRPSIDQASAAVGDQTATGIEQHLRARLTKTAHPCGCKSGALATLLALVGWPVWQVVAGLPHTWFGGAAAVGIYLAVIIGSAIAGKLAGIVVGRLEHRHLTRKLADLIARPEDSAVR